MKVFVDRVSVMSLLSRSSSVKTFICQSSFVLSYATIFNSGYIDDCVDVIKKAEGLEMKDRCSCNKIVKFIFYFCE
jgi:hypothetical protein